MKKFIVLGLALLSTRVVACPLGSHLVGGTGSHHKGGTCVYYDVTPVTPTYTPPVITTPVITPTYTPPVIVPVTLTPTVTTSTPLPITPDTTKPFNPTINYQAPVIDEIPVENRILQLDYEGFTVWLDCDKRGATKFRYNAQRDTGNLPRVADFVLDKNIPAECQQTSAKAYGHGYDRGHLVPANHLDYSANAIRESNYMTNVLPQVSTMNRGAWLATEEIVECYRDIDELLVIGGVVWGNNSKDDYFVKSHGVKTPDSFYKVVIRGNGDAIAWNVPNKATATRSKLDSFIVSVLEIERLTGERLPVGDSVRLYKQAKSWALPKNCNKG